MFHIGKLLRSANSFQIILDYKKIAIMNQTQTIDMPKGCRYMSDYDELLNGILPINGKFILNKTVTGCGGTSMFLNSDLSVVIISPRLQVLKEKHKQHPDTFLFHVPLCNNRSEAIRKKMSELSMYLDLHGNLPFDTLPKPAKILDITKSSQNFGNIGLVSEGS